MSVVLAHPGFRRGHKMKPRDKKIVPAEQHGIWRKMLTCSKMDKATLHPPIQIKAMLAPISKSPDSGASMHMLSKRGFELRRNEDSAEIQDPCNGGYSQWRKCKQTRNHKFSFTILISSWQCKCLKIRLQFCRLENSAKNAEKPMSGSAVKSHTWPNKGRRVYATRKISYLLLSLDCRQILVPVRPPHIHTRTRQVHLQVQQQSEVKIRHQETVARQTQKPLTKKIKRRLTIKIRTTVCEIFLNVWRRSQIIWRTQKSMCPHTLLRTQIPNVLQKWYQNQGSIILCSLPKRPKLRGMLAEQNDKGPLQQTQSQLMTPRSIMGRTELPDYDMLDPMIASALKKLFDKHTHFRKRVSVE